MARASTKAIPMNMVACTFPAASGFRPIASRARDTKIPIPIPGPNTPIPAAIAIATAFIASAFTSAICIAISISVINVLFLMDKYESRPICFNGTRDYPLMRLCHSHLNKEQCQHRKHKGLDKTDKEFKSVQRHWGDVRHKEHNHHQERLTSKNISEKTE